MSNYLITGGAGFIGTNLCKKLSGHSIYIIDNLIPKVHKNPTKPSVRGFYQGDVCDISSYLAFGDISFDAVIHLAAETGTFESMDKPKECIDTNITGTAVLCQAIRSGILHTKHIILTSSRAVYGNSYPVIKPTSVYGVSKYAQELLVQSLGIKTSILRLQNVYGPHQSIHNPYCGVMQVFIQQALNSQPIVLQNKGVALRDFIYVEDVVDDIIYALKSDFSRTTDSGTGVQISIKELADMITKVLPTEIGFNPHFLQGDVQHPPKLPVRQNAVPIEEGLNKTIEWIKNSK
jgi:nucleoside-diphosphate-sugar epimerase